MAAKRFPLRWWLTTGPATLFVVLFAVGLYQEWPGAVMLVVVLGFTLILWVVERHNEREIDVDQIWWVPSSVLWARPSRVGASIILMLAVFVAAAFLVFGTVNPWLLVIAVAASLLYRLVLGRLWLKRDRAELAASEPDAPSY